MPSCSFKVRTLLGVSSYSETPETPLLRVGGLSSPTGRGRGVGRGQQHRSTPEEQDRPWTLATRLSPTSQSSCVGLKKETRAPTLGDTIHCPDLPFNDPFLGGGARRAKSFHDIKPSVGPLGYEEPRPSINSLARSPDGPNASGASLGLRNYGRCRLFPCKSHPGFMEGEARGGR